MARIARLIEREKVEFRAAVSDVLSKIQLTAPRSNNDSSATTSAAAAAAFLKKAIRRHHRSSILLSDV